MTFAKLGRNISWKGEGVEERGVDQHGNVLVEIDPRYFRPTEVPHLLGDASRARNILGWKTNYTLSTLIEEMIAAAQSSVALN